MTYHATLAITESARGDDRLLPRRPADRIAGRTAHRVLALPERQLLQRLDVAHARLEWTCGSLPHELGHAFEVGSALRANAPDPRLVLLLHDPDQLDPGAADLALLVTTAVDLDPGKGPRMRESTDQLS